MQCGQHSLACVWDLQTTQKIYICLTNSFLTATSCHSQTPEQQGHLVQLKLTCFIKQPQALTYCDSTGKIRKHLDTSRAQFSTQSVYCLARELMSTSWAHDPSHFLQPGRRMSCGAAPLTLSWWQALQPQHSHSHTEGRRYMSTSSKPSLDTTNLLMFVDIHLSMSPLLTSILFTPFCFKFVLLLHYRQLLCYSPC